MAATDGDLRAWTHASMRLRKNSNEGMGRCVRARGNEGNKNCDGGSPSWPETEKNGGGRTNSGEKIRRPGGDTERAFGGRRKRRSRASCRNERFVDWCSNSPGIKVGRNGNVRRNSRAGS